GRGVSPFFHEFRITTANVSTNSSRLPGNGRTIRDTRSRIRSPCALPVGKGLAMRVANWSANCLRSPCPLFLGLGLLLAGQTGCGSGAKVLSLTNCELTLAHVAIAYTQADSRLGHPPKSAAELKPYLKEFGNPDELLISPNDGQPFVIIWGVDTTRGGPTDYKGMWAILAYEQKGASGKRTVADTRGRPLTIPAEDF